MKIMKIIFATILVAVAGTISAQSVWTSVVDGVWTDAGNWQGGTIPGSGAPVAITNAGTYVSHWPNNNLRVSVGDIAVGTTSSSGTQTLRVSGNAYQEASVLGNVSIGPRGIYNQQMSLVGISAAPKTFTVQAGGVLRSTSTDPRTWTLGTGRVLMVDEGGTVELVTGSGLMCNTLTLVSEIDGTIDGEGQFGVTAGGTLRLTGLGTISGGRFEIPHNGNLYLGGQLTLSRNLVKPVGATTLGGVWFYNGADVEINGNIQWDIVDRAVAIGEANSSAVATIRGNGVIDARFPNTTRRLGGHNSGYSTGGTINLQGAGELILRTLGGQVELYSSVFNLGRRAWVYGDGSSGSLRVPLNRVMNVQGTTGVLGIATNAALSISGYVRVRDGGAFRMNTGTVSGYVSGADPYALHLSDNNSAARFVLDAASDNLLVGVSPTQKLSVRLGGGTTVEVAEGARLTLRDVGLFMAMTGSSAWQFSNVGILRVGSGVSVEALSSNHGASISLKDEPFTLDRLGFAADATGLSLVESADNDGAGADTVLYVRTLDLSAMAGGSLGLDGLGGSEKVYYLHLVNPNGISFVNPSKWVQMATGLLVTVR